MTHPPHDTRTHPHESVEEGNPDPSYESIVSVEDLYKSRDYEVFRYRVIQFVYKLASQRTVEIMERKISIEARRLYVATPEAVVRKAKNKAACDLFKKDDLEIVAYGGGLIPVSSRCSFQ